MLDEPAQETHQTLVPEQSGTRSVWWWLAPILVALGSAGALHVVERTVRLVAPQILPEGYRFQDWTSNWLMQTMGLEEMLPFGPKSLVYDHIYPPLLDSIRYILTFPETGSGLPASPIAVDFRLYVIYAGCFGLVNSILFIWVRNLTKSSWWALGTTAVWALVPGYIMTMTLLDPSPLAMLFITSTLYFLYMFLRFRSAWWATAFFFTFLLASVTRSVTQPHVIAILAIAAVTFVFIARRRQWIPLVINLVLVSLMCIIPIKQYVMYGTLDTTTFGGYHRVGMLWIDPRTVPDPVYPQKIVDNALAFSTRYNTQETVKDNYRLSAAANDFIIHHPLDALARLGKSLTVTLPEIARPSSMYTENYLVERLPWRAPFDWVFSGWRYGLLLILSALVIVWSRGWSGIGRLLRKYGWFVVIYVLIAAPILLSNRYTPGQEDLGPMWTDAIRQKVFIEVPVISVMSYALWTLSQRLFRRAHSR